MSDQVTVNAKWLADLQRENEALRMRVAELEKDKARLNWMALNEGKLEKSGGSWTACFRGFYDDAFDITEEHATFRDAIDAAMREEG